MLCSFYLYTPVKKFWNKEKMSPLLPQSLLTKALALTGLLLLPIFGYLFWHLSTTPETLSTFTADYPVIGEAVQRNLETLPTLPITEEESTYSIQDKTSDGIEIKFANGPSTGSAPDGKPGLALSFPKDYSKPIEVKLDPEKHISFTDLSGKDGYEVSTLSRDSLTEKEASFYKRLFERQEVAPTYLRYTNDRKTLLYAYEKDRATGEKRLKHWTIYQEGNGLEKEEYKIEGAKVKLTPEGVAEVFSYGEKDLRNEAVKAEVEPSLLERAQRTLEKDLGNDILTTRTPDFTIPKPYYLDAQGEEHDLEWKWDEDSKVLSVSFSPESYPVALDPTLQFTAPGQSNTGNVVTGGATSDYFGISLTADDFNADGRTDLAVGAYNYSSGTGRAYIFYNDGFISTPAATADVIITGEAFSYFGISLTAGDFNADGKTDLAVGAYGYSTNTGRAHIFYNDGSIPTTAATADVTITGETTSNLFGRYLTAGDFNADGKTDLAVGAYGYSSYIGRTYVFYNDGSIPTTAGTADVTITGEATNNYFGSSLTAGDFNADGKTDLAVGASGYSTNTGRAYIFYNDGSIPTTAGTADVTITGEATSNSFGSSFAASDFNADGRTDLAVGAYGYSTNTGRAYIFYGDGSIPTTAGTADVTITGNATDDYFGISLTSGDFNADGKTDLVVGAYGYSINTGRAYIFYNDGSIPTTAATADVTITGETTSNYFGRSLTPGDFNADGKTDLAVGARGYSSNTGRAYIFYTQNGTVKTTFSTTGNATGGQFGI
ncbi:MAG: hypothetical protein E6P95_00350, partial [Candidatus Moraniibacteriota bacterium]